MTLAVRDIKSAPTYMFIVDGKMDVFRNITYHEESKLIARGLLNDDWVALIEQNIMLDGRPTVLEWFQEAYLRLQQSSIIEKARRIGMTTIKEMRTAIRSQFIPISFHHVSLTQKHTEDAMALHESIYDQMPNRWRAKRILDRVNEKRYLLLGNKHGSSLQSRVYAHACSSEATRGMQGDICFDEFPFYPPLRQMAMLKMVTPILNTTYRHYDDTERHYIISFIGTHNGDSIIFLALADGTHEFSRSENVAHLKLPWSVSRRVANNIHIIAQQSDPDDFLEEMCCVPLVSKDSPFPIALYGPLLKDIEFDQFGVRVFRDSNGGVLPFNRKRYEFISVGWDYASFKSETTGYGFGKIGSRYETVFYYRMSPEQHGGSIREEDIWDIINKTSQIMMPDYLGYDDTGVGAYLSRVLFDPAYGTGKDRIPRTDLYPYAEGADPVKFTNDFKGSNVNKLKTAMAFKHLIDIPIDEELQKQFRKYKRTLTPTNLIRYAAEGKGKDPKARDDIPSAMIIAIAPFHIENKPASFIERDISPILDIYEANILGEISGANAIFGSGLN